MIRLALLRHGPTAWNREGRLQGRADIPLDRAAIAALSRRRPPAELDGFDWFCSPLRRARDTAACFGVVPTIAPELIEMDWGAWEGRRLIDLRAEDPAGTAAAEAKGRDLRPPGGESPRAVMDRLAPFLAARLAAGRDCACVTHKGVIRAAIAQAFDWTMLGKPPVKLDWQCAHLLTLEAGGLKPLAFNLALAPA